MTTQAHVTDALSEAERREFAARGLTINDAAAGIEGATVEARGILRIELPSGAVVTAFTPKSKILGCRDAS